jgi:hypothetical protein
VSYLIFINHFLLFHFFYRYNFISFSISANSNFSKSSSSYNFSGNKVSYRNLSSLKPIIFRFFMQYLLFNEFFLLFRKTHLLHLSLQFIPCFFPFFFLIFSFCIFIFNVSFSTCSFFFCALTCSHLTCSSWTSLCCIICSFILAILIKDKSFYLLLIYLFFEIINSTYLFVYGACILIYIYYCFF